MRKTIIVIGAEHDCAAIGKHVVNYAIDECVQCSDNVYVATHNERIAEIAEQAMCETILIKNKNGTVKTAVERVCKEDCDVLFCSGNSVMLVKEIINKCIVELRGNEKITGVMTVYRDPGHPRNSVFESRYGYCQEYKEIAKLPEKPAYRFDGLVLGFRSENIDSTEGPRKYPFLGAKVKLIKSSWFSGRTIENDMDKKLAEAYLKCGGLQ